MLVKTCNRVFWWENCISREKLAKQKKTITKNSIIQEENEIEKEIVRAKNKKVKWRRCWIKLGTKIRRIIKIEIKLIRREIA